MRMEINLYAIIIFICFLFTHFTDVLADCPDPQLLKPCVCVIKDMIYNHGIYCGGHTDIDLVGIFTNVSKALPKNKKSFDRFHLNNTFITQLKANTTQDLTFGDITIEQAQNLTYIHEDAFGDTTNVTDSLRIFYNPKLGNHTSLFGAVKKFSQIVVLSLDFNNITEIPSNALSHHNWLEDVTLRGPSITKIGEKAFQFLKILNTLEITQTNIDYFPENAFFFQIQDSGGLVFIVYDNNRINGSSFAANSLSHFQKRKVNFYYLSKTKQKVQYLDQKVFLPFLLANNQSLVSINRLEFDCSDCRSYWLKKYPELKRRVNNFVCSDGKAFNDKTHFTNCQN